MFVTALLAAALAAPVPKSLTARRPDAEAIQGRWVCATLDTGAGPQADVESWLELKDGTLSNGRADLKGHVRIPFALDPSHAPGWIDIMAKDVPVDVGVYELDGDTLRWSFSQPGQPRPTEVSAKSGTGCRVWKRVKEEPKK